MEIPIRPPCGLRLLAQFREAVGRGCGAALDGWKGGFPPPQLVELGVSAMLAVHECGKHLLFSAVIPFFGGLPAVGLVCLPSGFSPRDEQVLGFFGEEVELGYVLRVLPLATPRGPPYAQCRPPPRGSP